MREEHRLRVFENRLLREIFGPNSDEVTAEWRRLQNAEVTDLHSSPNIIRVCRKVLNKFAYTVAYRTHYAITVYNILPEDEPPVSKHIEDILKILKI